MSEVLQYNLKVSEFEHQFNYCIHFQTNAPWERYELLYPSSYGLNAVLLQVWIWY